MAKQQKEKLSPEEKALEKERLERIRKEERDLKIKVRAKAKRKKERERRVAIKEKNEERRIRKIVRFPFKILFQAALLFTLLTFIVLYFGSSTEVYRALYLSFIIFTSLYLGIGLIMTGVIYFVSQEKLIEKKRQKREDEAKEKERLAQEEEELDKLLRAEVEEMSGESGSLNLGNDEPNLIDSDSSAEDMMIDLDELENFDRENSEVNIDDEEDVLGKLDSEFPSDESNDGDEQGQDSFGEEEKEEVEPFFSEDDFMNDLVFGTEGNKENE